MREALYALTDRGHSTDNLMPGNDRQFGFGQIAIDNVKISAADSTRFNPYEYLPRFWGRLRDVSGLKRLTPFFQDHCPHI